MPDTTHALWVWAGSIGQSPAASKAGPPGLERVCTLRQHRQSGRRRGHCCSCAEA